MKSIHCRMTDVMEKLLIDLKQLKQLFQLFWHMIDLMYNQSHAVTGQNKFNKYTLTET